MKRSTVLLAVVSLVLVTGAASYTRAQISARRTAAHAAQQTATFFPTEQLWIVKDITAAIGNMAAYANRGSTASGAHLEVRQVPKTGQELARFEVTRATQAPLAIAVTDHIWAAGAYTPVAAAAIGGAGAACAAPDVEIAAALLQPTRAIIQRENARVSARLRADMRCAGAHTEAALLLGTLALREAALSFNDPRRLISRMAAHLAVADAMGLAPDNGLRRLDDAVLYTLAGRQRTAIDRVNAIEAAAPTDALRSWSRALRIRNTADWRILPDPNRGTLLEQIELVRAVDNSLGDPRTLDFLDAIHDLADVPDWSRIVMQGRPGVDAGNRFADAAVALELREAAEARKDYAPAVTLDSSEALINELKAEPAGGPVGADGSVWVVDWPAWAAITERHLMTTINARDTHLTSTLSLKKEAQEFRDQVARTFSGLRLYPLLAITLAPTKEEARPGMAGSLRLIQTHPELVTHWMWKSVLAKETWSGLPVSVPRLESWFTPAFPVGTVFEPNTRPWAAGPTVQFSAATIVPFRDAAPWSRQLTFVSIGTAPDKAPVDLLRKEFGEMSGYNLDFAKRIANAMKDDPAAYSSAMEDVIELSPEHLFDLAAYSVNHDNLAQARSAYERWFAAGRDEVAIANSAEWMVRDYFLRHEYAKAAALADRAAQTYSYGGLVVRARLYDWSGDARSAERFYRMAAERYESPSDLLGFYIRQGRKGMDVDRLMWKVFPGGLTPIVMPSLREAPKDGISVEIAGLIGERNGMRPGDIVVGVDGIRVQNMWQYHAAKTASTEPVVRYTVWRDLHYIEVPARLRYGWLGSGIMNYQPGAGRKDLLTPRPRR